MLSVNFADNASLSADSTYSESTDIYNAVFEDKSVFFATSAEKNEAVIDISLSGECSYNVLLIGEKIELGERITSFKLEAVEDGKLIPIAEGTSVGYLKATRFKECSYKTDEGTRLWKGIQVCTCLQRSFRRTTVLAR